MVCMFDLRVACDVLVSVGYVQSRRTANMASREQSVSNAAGFYRCGGGGIASRRTWYLA